VGIVIYFVAFTGMAFRKETQANLKPGESITMQSAFGHEFTFTHLGVSQFKALNRYVTAASVEVSRDGKRLTVMRSEKRQHVRCSAPVSPCPPQFERASFEPSTEAGIRSDLREDIYIVFAGAVDGTEEAVYRFTLTPLVWWLWFGGVVLVTGGIVVMWPGAGPSRQAPRRAHAGYEVKLGAPEKV
jgi:cytochrome c-type biogenesis protein CcmF